MNEIRNIHGKIGAEIQGFGGHLECQECGHTEPLGNTGNHLAKGWPKCCGYTMRWLTQRELDDKQNRLFCSTTIRRRMVKH